MTRAERLQAIVAALAPVRHAHQAATGDWLKRPGDDSPDRYERRTGDHTWEIDKSLTAGDADADPTSIRRRRRESAPYELLTLGDGSRRVIVFGEDGGRTAGTGPTLEDALQDLERKVFGAAGRPE